MRNIRGFVLSSRYLLVYMRFFSVVLLFGIEEPLVVYFGFWGISSILLLPGVLACWLFPWSTAFVLEWCLLLIHTIIIVACKGWCGYVAMSFIAGTITDLVLVG